MAQTSNQKMNEEVQKAIEINKLNLSETTKNSQPSNFLIGTCLNVQGTSQCNLDLATRNINNYSSKNESWIFFLESRLVFESYIRGLNGQISNADGFISTNVRFRVIDRNNVERDLIRSSNCIHTTLIRKNDENTIIEKTIGVTDGCSEDYKRIFRPDLNKWSEPKPIYPLINRFPISILNQPRSQAPTATTSNRLINDLFRFRWVESVEQCDAVNTNYTLYDRTHGRYFVIGGKKMISPSHLLLEIGEVSDNQVNIFHGMSLRARSDGLFNTIVKLQIARQSDGSTLVHEISANDLDLAGDRLLTKDGPFTRTPNITKYFPCLNDASGASSSSQVSPDIEIKFNDGSSYLGKAKDGKPHGQGTYTWPSGARFIGESNNGKLNGQGTYTFSNGNRYVGEWEDNRQNGKGTYTWANGDQYIGEFKGGLKDGIGTIITTNGARYVGEYKNDKMNGQGTFTWPGGDQYTGRFNDGLKDGQGTLTLKNGTKTVGLFKDDKYVGPQTHTQSPSKPAQVLNYSHGRYVGETLNGKAHGLGTYTSAQSGTVYKGEFITDTFSGVGTMTWTDGSQFYGKWQNDVGVSGTLTQRNGASMAGVVKNGVFSQTR